MLASIRRSATAPAGTVSGFIARVVLIGCWAAFAAMAFFIVARLAVPDRFLVLIWARPWSVTKQTFDCRLNTRRRENLPNGGL